MNNMYPVIVVVLAFYLVYRYVRLYKNAKKVEYEFTSIVNHAFRTPLTRINWITKELEKDMPRQEELQYLQNLSNATTRLLEIVDLIAGIKNIRDVASYNFEATSLRDVLEKSIAKYRADINKKNITFEVPTFRDIPLLTVDLKKISFVVDTLIENAIIYTPQNGKIFVECISKLKGLVLYVGDDGIGLSFQDRIKIFSKFYRSKRAVLAYPDGMGLRLYLSRQIVSRHNGSLYAKSKGVNKGTTFFLKLPFNR